MKKRLTLTSLLLAASLLLSSCSAFGRDIRFSVGNTMSTAFQIENMKCPRQEALIYIMNYRNLYSHIGDQDLWSGAFDEDRLRASIKTSCIDNLSEVYILNLYAKENGIFLSEADDAKIETAAKEYYASLTEEEKKYSGAREKDIHEMYTRYATAEKVYAELMDSVDEEVSEDEARVMRAFVLYTKDPAKANAAEAALSAGTSFDVVLATYGDGDRSQLSFGRNTYSSDVEDVIFRLENGEVSSLITADDGYYIVRCIEKYDEALSEENKTKILADRKDRVLTGIFESADSMYYSKINTTFWESIVISADNTNLKTDSFFLTLDKYYRS